MQDSSQDPMRLLRAKVAVSDASDRACFVRPYFYLRLFLRMHSDQTEFCVSYDFLIASSRAPIVKAPLICQFCFEVDILAYI